LRPHMADAYVVSIHRRTHAPVAPRSATWATTGCRIPTTREGGALLRVGVSTCSSVT
jgi:hypothetical protein